MKAKLVKLVSKSENMSSAEYAMKLDHICDQYKIPFIVIPKDNSVKDVRDCITRYITKQINTNIQYN